MRNNLRTPATSSAELNIKIKAETAAKDLQAIFKAFTPQFYRSKSEREILNEQSVIKAAIMDISVPVLIEMARLAVKQYKVARGFNKQTYFNLDYFLDFYVTAFNAVNYYVPDCKYKVLSESLSGNLETVTVELEIGKTVVMQRYIETQPEEKSPLYYSESRYYSELSYKQMIDDIDDIQF